MVQKKTDVAKEIKNITKEIKNMEYSGAREIKLENTILDQFVLVIKKDHCQQNLKQIILKNLFSENISTKISIN